MKVKTSEVADQLLRLAKIVESERDRVYETYGTNKTAILNMVQHLNGEVEHLKALSLAVKRLNLVFNANDEDGQ